MLIGYSVLFTAVVDAPTGHVTLGANMANGIEQKGIDTLQQCLKKCAAAGLGIPATVCKSVNTVNRYRRWTLLCQPTVFTQIKCLFNRTTVTPQL